MVAYRAMVAQEPGVQSSARSSVDTLIAALDPEVRAAIDDVDRSLIWLSLAQTPWERLRSASRTAQYLAGIRDATASQGR